MGITDLEIIEAEGLGLGEPGGAGYGTATRSTMAREHQLTSISSPSPTGQ